MGANFHSDYSSNTVFSPTDLNPPLQSLDRAITYGKNILVHCDGAITYDGATGQLSWDNVLRIRFTTSAGLFVENIVAAGGIILADNELAYVDLSETNGAELSVTASSPSLGATSAVIPFNRLVLGYRNSVSDDFYPVALRAALKSSELGDMLKSVYDTDNDGQVEKADEADAVNWAGLLEVPAAIEDIAGLTLTGNAGKALIVNPAGDGVILGDAGATDLLALTDFPDAYTGMAGKLIAVKSDESGVEFISAAGGGGGLNDLSDVVITTPSDGQALVFDSSDSKWKNEAISSGGTASFASVATIASMIGGF